MGAESHPIAALSVRGAGVFTFGSLTQQVRLAELCAARGAARILMARTASIVDDHPRRTSARRVLEDAGYTVIGEAPDGSSALAAIRAHRPDLVLLDVQVPDIDGFGVPAQPAWTMPPRSC